MKKRRRVIIDADHCGPPLWDTRGVGLDVDGFPLSDGLKADLNAWARRFDRLYESDEAAGWGAFEAEKFTLRRRLQEELGAEWLVGYFRGSRRVYEDPDD